MAPPTALEKLIVARKNIKKNIDYLTDKINSHTVAAPLTKSMVLKLIGIAETFDSKLSDNYNYIINIADAADVNTHTKEYTSLYEESVEVLCGLEEIRSDLNMSTTTTKAPGCGPDIRLPRMVLPVFSGDLQEWNSFKDIFKSTVHDNVSLSKVQKMTYLKSTLSGEAARLIQNMQLTNASYDTAWSQLEDRYQNDRELLFSILRRLFLQQNVQVQSASSVRSLIDVTKECIRSLEALHRPVDTWDDVILFHMFQKLDMSSRELWEQSLKDSSIPTLHEFMDFLEARARALAAGTPSSNVQKSQGLKNDGNSARRVHHTQNSTPTCKVCSKGDHFLFQCQMFNSMSVSERKDVVKKNSLCFNCLRHGHSISKCTSFRTCKTCQRKHHTLIHENRVSDDAASAASKPTTTPTTVGTTNPATTGTTTTMHTSGEYCVQQTLLATAVVDVHNPSQVDRHQLFRAMEDGCSNSSFVSEKCVQSLGLMRTKVNVEITGVGGISLGRAKGITTLSISPYFNSNIKVTINCFILPTISGMMPEQRCDPTMWPHLQGLQLADPKFHEPAPVDLLLGADVFWYHLQDGRRIGLPETPVGLRSTFGWLIAGNLDSMSNHIRSNMTTVDLDRRLQQFWEVESIPTSRSFTKEERLCELHFESSHSRDLSGRYTVKLPFKDPPPVLGSSRDSAIRRLKHLERRLSVNPEYKEQYHKFMDEYLELKHMELVPTDQIYNNSTCYLPHHFVLKGSSTTTKFRVVFDASANTSSGVSLNEALMVGPTIQDTLIELLTRFRLHPIAFTADLAKMYRQVRVTPQDSDMQRILWRNSPSESIQDYRLLTVTYGTASAPYLATRALHQLANDERQQFPQASDILQQDMYVDDLMSGSQKVKDAIELSGQLIALTSKGGHELRKWSSNSQALLATIHPDLRETKTILEMNSDQTIKALGVYWNTTQDIFQFKLTLDDPSPAADLTKRKLLSQISKFFDPLGFAAPAIIPVKILMQDVWILKCEWDEVLPENIRQQWNTYRTNLQQIENITINRCMVPRDTHFVHLMGFCDASIKAYAAVVYLCSDDNNGKRLISLISSKTRVAPVKLISLPKLELYGALLLSQLMTNIQKALKIKFQSILAFTDSTIVRDWIKGQPAQWKVFVANRVTEIQERVPVDSWHHVSGVDNPADCASRGIDPSELQMHPLWWQGPSWLKSGLFPPIPEITADERIAADLERNQKVISCNMVNYDTSLIHKFSTMQTLIRVTAWIHRFVQICRVRVQIKKSIFPNNQLPIGPLTPFELQQSLQSWIRVIQDQEFHEEVHCLRKQQSLPTKSKILSLSPFLDSFQVLRVGGRLRRSNLDVAQKHPILLPRHHQFTRLLIASEHLKHLHAGAQLLLSIIIRRYWIVAAKDAIRHQIKKCVTCTRHSATTHNQFMGDLPSYRVTPARPFQRCGVDYAGPFNLRAIPSRSKVTFKSYLAIFVCFTTRAVHLEVVSSLTSEAFLATMRRFIARRGKPTDVHSDCGTNFVGAAKEIKELVNFIQSPTTNNKLSNEMSKDDIHWHFNPAGAPHMGGLWEAGVKSVKFHLYRVLGSARLTFEQLTTVMTQIEACLNSRPLTALSTDPNDITALTPGHFLIGAPLTALPDLDFSNVKEGRLSQWQLLQQMTQRFWNRWSSEFISRMQQRPKWHNKSNLFKINDLILIKDERLPPLKWKLGRITQLHPGPDGIIRVVSLKTSDCNTQRHVSKICLLPIDSTNDPESEVIG